MAGSEGELGDTTLISWTHRTFNGWIGCEHMFHVDPVTGERWMAQECALCYAERQNFFHKWNGGVWGPGAERKLTTAKNWMHPFNWNHEAQKGGYQDKAFAFSLADVFDVDSPEWPADRVLLKPSGPPRHRAAQIRWMNRAPEQMRAAAWAAGMDRLMARDVFFHEVIRETKSVSWQVLTKRFDEAAAFYQGLWGGEPWENVESIFSAGTQRNLAQAMRARGKFEAKVHGISAEPLLSPMDFTRVQIQAPQYVGNSLMSPGVHINALTGPTNLDWVIVGGESGPKARPMHPDWVRKIRDDCKAAGVAFFFKQWGEWIPKSQLKFLPAELQNKAASWNRPWGTLTASGEWFEKTTPWNGHDDDGTGEAVMFKVGKDASGDWLDGKQYQEFPR